ncbi:MAG TPA: 5-oxoprolinase subunit PxpB [Bryobacteraceae bacterium]|nr:5-oxoprolinase subunit PxpB [Bryobacteraceae bacterium]
MFRFASDQALYVDGPPEAMDLAAMSRIPGVVNLHPAYASVLVVFDPLRTGHRAVEQEILALPGRPLHLPRTHHYIPVRYDGPDLDAVAALHGLSRDEATALHAGAIYTVAFLGFAPGFAYLSGLPEALRTPRLATPRKVVPAGSVGIAGQQTGVYPLETPGGWQLIGHTDVRMFDVERTPMSLLQPGDRVSFEPV